MHVGDDHRRSHAKAPLPHSSGEWVLPVISAVLSDGSVVDFSGVAVTDVWDINCKRWIKSDRSGLVVYADQVLTPWRISFGTKDCSVPLKAACCK